MTIQDQIEQMETKAQALELYKLITQNPDARIEDFTNWAGFQRQTYYDWDNPLPDKTRFQLYGRLTKLLKETTHAK